MKSEAFQEQKFIKKINKISFLLSFGIYNFGSTARLAV